ncbi:MAG: bifunctional 2-polyprenyl-6-hydroxyphenol methylase/3-demethylubiquinol 3-O-methyltransferase UbiG, partial [Steroidobacteraceae bacterium]
WAHRFWDPQGEFKPLHILNPTRLAFIRERATLAGARVVDVGCGGGLLAEGLARANAQVLAIDLAEPMLEVARLHAVAEGLTIDYQCLTAETLAKQHSAQFDVVTCMEMLEHVPDPNATLQALSTLLRPGGHLFISTINRNLRAFLLAIVGAEYLLKIIPAGTHEYERLIRPSELARYARAADLELVSLAGLAYDPLTSLSRLTQDVSVNYLCHLQKLA